MPHLTVHAEEHQLAGREVALVSALTDSIAEVYGEWARPLVVARLVGVPRTRWAVGGTFETAPGPEVTLGVRASALLPPEGPEAARRLVAGLTDAVVSVLGEELRASVLVELVPQADDLVGTGGVLVADQT